MLTDGLYTLVSQETTITAIVGTPGPSGSRAQASKGRAKGPDVTTGVFAVLMPEGAALPAIVISEVGSPRPKVTMDRKAIYYQRVQFYCYGKIPEDAINLRVAVRRFLAGFQGILADAPDDAGTQILFTDPMGEFATFEEAPGIFHAPIDFEFQYIDSGQ